MVGVTLRPGTIAPQSGVYEQIGKCGRTGARIRVLRGRTLPTTIDPDDGWELVSATEDRPPPPMQVVTKGWWTLREDRAPVEELEQEDREEQRQA
jgi:hypothetical protein